MLGELLPPTTLGPKKNAFVYKLYQMLCDDLLRDVIWWTGDEEGGAFALSPGSEFSRVLSNYFKHANILLFVRQLHMYGFHKVSDTQQPLNTTTHPQDDARLARADHPVWEFRHLLGKFRKGGESSLGEIRRRTASNNNRTNVLPSFPRHQPMAFLQPGVVHPPPQPQGRHLDQQYPVQPFPVQSYPHFSHGYASPVPGHTGPGGPEYPQYYLHYPPGAGRPGPAGSAVPAPHLQAAPAGHSGSAYVPQHASLVGIPPGFLAGASHPAPPQLVPPQLAPPHLAPASAHLSTPEPHSGFAPLLNPHTPVPALTSFSAPTTAIPPGHQTPLLLPFTAPRPVNSPQRPYHHLAPTIPSFFSRSRPRHPSVKVDPLTRLPHTLPVVHNQTPPGATTNTTPALAVSVQQLPGPTPPRPGRWVDILSQQLLPSSTRSHLHPLPSLVRSHLHPQQRVLDAETTTQGRSHLESLAGLMNSAHTEDREQAAPAPAIRPPLQHVLDLRLPTLLRTLLLQLPAQLTRTLLPHIDEWHSHIHSQMRPLILALHNNRVLLTSVTTVLLVFSTRDKTSVLLVSLQQGDREHKHSIPSLLNDDRRRNSSLASILSLMLDADPPFTPATPGLRRLFPNLRHKLSVLLLLDLVADTDEKMELDDDGDERLKRHKKEPGP